MMQIEFNVMLQILIILFTSIIEILVILYPSILYSEPYKYIIGLLIAIDILVLLALLKEI
ncbi:MAG: hypothetical protein ACP5GJ_02725 [Nanopusillaceae archaeon]